MGDGADQAITTSVGEVLHEGSDAEHIDAEHIDADQIDLSFRALPAASTRTVESQGEAIIVDLETMMVSHLDRMGAVVWSFLDGDATVGELATDLAVAFQGDEDVVRSDVLTLLHELGDRGHLSGVAAKKYGTADFAATQGLGEGSPLPEISLTALDGTPLAAGPGTGRRHLLVNWNPSCGYCVLFAPVLAKALPALEEAGIGVVLLAASSVEANEVLAAEHGLSGVVGVRDPLEEGDVFSGIGTPVGYLVDSDGSTASSMKTGTYELADLLAEVLPPGTLGPVVPPAPAAHDHDHEDHDHDEHDGHEHDGHDHGGAPVGTDAAHPRGFLPEPASTCGPSASTQVWAGSDAFGIGRWYIGIRCDTDEANDVVRRLLGGAYAPDLVPPGANFSLVLPGVTGTGARSTRALNLLVRGGASLVRSRNPARVLRGLLAHLDPFLGAEPEGLRTGAMAVVHQDGSAALLPGQARGWLQQMQPRLNRVGFQIVDAPYVSLDLDRDEVIVHRPGFEVDAELFERLDLGPSGSELAAVAPGRYPLTIWAFLGAGDPPRPTSPALAASANLGVVDVGYLGFEETAAAMVGLFERVLPFGVWYTSAATLVAQLEQARRLRR